MEKLPKIDTDIRTARPLPSRFYRSTELFEATRNVFATSWQWLGPLDECKSAASPLTLLPEFLGEPIVAARSGDAPAALFPNVCTHRAHPLCLEPSDRTQLACGYHGRRFDLEGKCLGAPGFEGVGDFPDQRDHLRALGTQALAGHRFVQLAGAAAPELLPKHITQRINIDALRRAKHVSTRDRDFEVDSHWALYVENYLEGFHVPFVHPSLHKTLDPKDYTAEPFDGGVLQIGRARNAAEAFGANSALVGLAETEADRVAAYYLWWFPNTMWNIYPWGLSVNVVEPVTPNRTRVRFRAYLFGSEGLSEAGAGGDLDAVEAEDEAVVERVQRGVSSRNWRGARYSPSQEAGVHQFHRLLIRALSKA